MTSKISFHKLVREDIKKRSWLTALSAIVFMIVLPIFTAMEIDNQGRMVIYDEIENAVPQLQRMQEWFVGWMGFQNIWVIWAIMFGAVICGVTSFAYLHSKSQMDFYHSLPVKREKWFAAAYVSGFIQVIVPYVIGYVFMGLTGYVKGVFTTQLLYQSPLFIGVNILFFLWIYSLTIFAMILTGKLFVAMLGLGVFMFGGSVLGALKIYIMRQSFLTYMDEGTFSGMMGNVLFGKTSWFSPMLAYGNMSTLFMEKESLMKPMAIISVCIVLITMLALGLYKIRSSESAGSAIAFPKLKPAIKIASAIVAGVLFGVIVGSQNRSHGMNTGWLFGVGILATIIAYAVVDFIYHTDMKLIFKKKLSLGISLAGTLMILSIVQYDLLGYDTYLPKKEKLEAMSVYSYYVQENWLNDISTMETELPKFLDEMRVEDFDFIYELAKNGVERVENVNSDQDLESSPQAYVTIAYYLKSGRAVYRGYYVDYDKYMECMENVMEDRAYREKVFDFAELDREKNEFTFLNFRQREAKLQLSEEEEKALIDAYKQDVLAYPVDEFETGEVIGEFRFRFKEPDNYFQSKVYKQFTRTIALLEKYGYEVPTKITLEEVKSMTFQDYSEEGKNIGVEVDKGIQEKPITDPEKMQSILNHILYTENKLAIPNVYIQIQFQNSDWATYNLREK